jgi:alkylation response protein AidB-like acyl-CoA dehydrogenase
VDLSISDDQRLLEDSVVRFVRNEYEFDQRREIADSDDGFSRAHWATFAELGWLALPFAEVDGGLGGDATDVMVVMEQFGRGLVLEPYMANVLLAGQAIARAGSEAQRAALLGPLIAGEAQFAFAHVEGGARFTLSHVETTAEASDDGYRLNGAKAVVFNAAAADHFVVSARTGGGTSDSDGVSLFVVPAGADGVTLRSYRTIDGLRAAEVALDGVQVGADSLLGEAGSALPVIEEVIDRATAAVCSEAVGAMDMLREATLEYLQTRKQFGVPIGKFQVLQHRSVEMMISCEESRSLTMMATMNLDKSPKERARAVSAAKAHIGKAGRHVGQEAIQMHGGMGMTDELKVGHYFKRLTMIDTLFGNIDHHLDRFADTEQAA